MSEKYLNIDLNDPRASAIADVMGNKTAKKILDLIAEKEVSESDIATELKVPLNTVGYNIDKLLKAGLVEKSKNFFWSVKGKKIPTYKLSNKKILISPKRLTVTPIAMIASILGVIIIVALLVNMGGDNRINNIISQGNENDSSLGLKQFSSYSELEDFLDQRINESQTNYEYYGGRETLTATADSSTTGAISESKSAPTYSQTNIQVSGVDEPDFVKNDDKYIYVISGQNLYIVEAYPANEMKIVSNISLPEYASNMFVNGDKLIVIFNRYSYYDYNDLESQTVGVNKIAVDSIMPCYGYGCGGYSKTETSVLIYDISQRENPLLSENYSFEGNYIDARMTGDYVYVISQNYIYGSDFLIPFYSVNGVQREIPIDNIYYSNEFDESFTFTSVSSISLNDAEVESKVYLLGNSGTIYVSKENIYLTNQKYLSYEKQTEMRLKQGIIPVMPAEYKKEMEKIIDGDESYYSKNQKIMALLYDYIKSLDKESQSDFNKELQNSLNDAEEEIAKEYQKTIIHKISVDGMNIEYIKEGEIPGYLLNQFSLDEFDENLRVAVTIGNIWGGKSSNALFVLDEDLNVIGSVEDIAVGETIYSVRFMGERAYMVTFKTVDPLFVIDLSDSKNPKILGYLKIPGYSNYLHPYDENHVIGIGKDVDESIDADKVHSSDAVYYTAVQGLKISIFNVEDVEHPVETAKIVLGERGSDSIALNDHKAFLFDKEKSLLVLPVTLTEMRNVTYNYGDGEQTYEEPFVVFSGAYVFDISDNSIDVHGKITHVLEKEYLSPAKEERIGSERIDSLGHTWEKIAINAWKTNTEGYEYLTYSDYQVDYFPDGYLTGIGGYYDYSSMIQRSIFMDNNLYTISLNKIKASDLENLKEINEVNLFYSSYYPSEIAY